MAYVILAVIAFLAGVAVVRFVPKARAAVCEGWESTPAPTPPIPPPDSKLQAAVEALHFFLFPGGVAGGADMYYNAVWKAAGLEESGAPK